MPELRFPIITGVSAGAINAAYLASHPGSMVEAAEGLTRLWSDLQIRHVFRADSFSLLRHMAALGSCNLDLRRQLRSHPACADLVDTEPLRRFLARLPDASRTGKIVGIEDNLDQGAPRGRCPDHPRLHDRADSHLGPGMPRSRAGNAPTGAVRRRELTLDHVMASSSLPLFFPAVQTGRPLVWRRWHPAVGTALSGSAPGGAPYPGHLDALRPQTDAEAAAARGGGLPAAGPDRGQSHERRVSRSARPGPRAGREVQRHAAQKIPPAEERGEMRILDIEVLRPSVDLGRLSADYEAKLPGAFRFLTRGLGTKRTTSPDYLSLLMFEPELSATADRDRRGGRRGATRRPRPLAVAGLAWPSHQVSTAMPYLLESAVFRSVRNERRFTPASPRRAPERQLFWVPSKPRQAIVTSSQR